MATDGRHKDVECSICCSRNCIDTIERYSIGMSVHEAEKFFSLRGKTANSGECGQKVNNRTYPDFVYGALYRPQRDIDNKNGHGCDDRHSADWKRTPVAGQSATIKWPKNCITHSEGMGIPGLCFDQLGRCGSGRRSKM